MVDVALPRGVIVRGKVLEEVPIHRSSGRRFNTLPKRRIIQIIMDQILTGWQDIHLTDNEGRFQIVVLPGPGRLLVHGAGESFVLQETSGVNFTKEGPGANATMATLSNGSVPAPNSAPRRS